MRRPARDQAAPAADAAPSPRGPAGADPAEVMDMSKTKSAAVDPLLPLIQKMDLLWADALSTPFWEKDLSVAKRDVEKLFVRPFKPDPTKGDEHQPLHPSVMFNEVIDTSLVLYELGDAPMRADGIQHQLQCGMGSLYRFLWDWVMEFIDVDAAEQRRRRDEFFRLRDLIGSVRFALSNGRYGAIDATPKLNDNAWRAGEFIRKNKGAKGLTVARAIGVGEPYFRGDLFKLLKPYGFKNYSENGQGNGYYKDPGKNWPKWPKRFPPV
jgi:hypothetical protein